MRMPHNLRVIGAVALALGVLAACGGGGDNEDADPQGKDLVSAEKLCDGIFSKNSVRALQDVTGVTKFQSIHTGDGLEGTVKKIVEEYDPDGASPQLHDFDLCLVYKPTSGGLSDIDITFSLNDGKDVGRGGKDPSFAKYKIGREALANTKVAVLYAECVSPKMPGSESSPALLRGELRHRGEPDGSAEKVRKANLTLVNSAALALSKRLECRENAGLSETPNLAPLS